ncbi:GNAT family N-acetyltransferase [Rheinheimera sp. YQF-2]|uniref:GNAT family N-acetyltransferase n=1 Tax=Rheinheimera lutimaris TaxID=2740584 RepID=A0A7Y5AQ41_9GAMM|nr:GNAT family N-acetyltransferase [Rheinheimera lutimaris]NRQ41960.1 GNAT family N-acetyltransferase [Rheinheimera lutimaris]
MITSIKLRKVNSSGLAGDIGAIMMLADFYGIEMSSALKWSVEQRLLELSKARMMVWSGESVMVLANDLHGMPLGMILYTTTDDKTIRRIDALFVIEKFRGKGISTKLLQAIKEDKDFHTYATPSSVGWYEKNGFRVLRNHPEGTVEMTTAGGEPNYEYTVRVPIPSEMDNKFIEKMKKFEEERAKLGKV